MGYFSAFPYPYKYRVPKYASDAATSAYKSIYHLTYNVISAFIGHVT